MKLKKSVSVFIGIGSNIGNRINNILRSLKYIKKRKNMKIKKISSFYLTEPEGEKMTKPFVNCAIEVSTDLTPSQLLETLEDIERKMGRRKKGTMEDRVIDLDILFYGTKKIASRRLTIPHPRAHLRRFVLAPLSEIAPEFVHPQFKKNMRALLDKLTDNSIIIKLGLKEQKIEGIALHSKIT